MQHAYVRLVFRRKKTGRGRITVSILEYLRIKHTSTPHCTHATATPARWTFGMDAARPTCGQSATKRA